MTDNQSLPEYPNYKCRVFGHRWQKTTSDNFRICDRDNCHAAERFSNGAWIAVERRKLTRKRTVTEPAATLF